MDVSGVIFAIITIIPCGVIVFGIVFLINIYKAPKPNAYKGSIIIRTLKWGHMQIVPSILGATEVMMDNPDNFVGGIDIRVIFTNNTSKIIKYVTFTFGAVNAVGDDVNCTVRHSCISNGQFTGPLNPSATSPESLVFRNMFYNASIKKIVIHKAIIEYMDGTMEEQTQF